jgi:hypothetical protein
MGSLFVREEEGNNIERFRVFFNERRSGLFYISIASICIYDSASVLLSTKR